MFHFPDVNELDQDLDRLLVQFCSPTLAGIKAANLFNVRAHDRFGIDRRLAYGNGKLNGKGVFLRCLKHWDGKALILVYRRRALEAILGRDDVRDFLRHRGYVTADVERCIDLLSLRTAERDFPHEIGVFLGYPLEDVRGFIENRGERSLLARYWKVYSNEESTRTWFLKMDKVRDKYIQSYLLGRTIESLTVCQKGA